MSSVEMPKGNGFRGRNNPPVLPGTGWTAPLTTLASASMAFLVVLALAASMAANRLAAEWRADLAGVATVRVSASDDGSDDKLKAVLEVLRTTPGIDRVRVLTDQEQAALIEPWLGESANLRGLPAPQLIDVSLDGAGPDAAALQGRLDLTVSGVVYDDHAAWRAPLTSAAGALEWLALGAGALLLVIAAAIVAFAARATLVANKRVVETVRLIGAPDDFISGAFVNRLVRRSLLGGLIGAWLGCGVLLMLPSIDAEASAIGVSLSPSPAGWAVLAIGVPLISALITWIAARSVVRWALHRMP